MIDNSTIYQVSIIRSGSTLVYQILRSLFPGDRIVKQHHFPEDYNGEKIVSTYRDLRDVLVSTWRTFILSKNRRSIKSVMTEEDVDLTLLFLRKYIDQFNIGKEKFDKEILWLKYEDFYMDSNVIFDALEMYFDTDITDCRRKDISEDCSIDKNRERSKAFSHFGEYDYLGTEIHGDHIFNGEIGGWKKIIPVDLYNTVNEKLKDDLKLFGYE